MSLTQVTVTGHYTTPEGDDATGRLTFVPSTTLQNTVDDQFVAGPVTVELVDGAFSVVLYATDDTGTQPDGATYRVTERVAGVLRTYQVQINSGAGTVDLADLVPTTATEQYAYSALDHTHDGGEL